MDLQLYTVTINLGPRSYPVYIGENLLDEAGRLCRKASLNGHAALVTDTKVGALYCKQVLEALTNSGFKASVHLVNAGELSKSSRPCVRTLLAMELIGKVSLLL